MMTRAPFGVEMGQLVAHPCINARVAAARSCWRNTDLASIGVIGSSRGKRMDGIVTRGRLAAAIGP